MEIYKFKILSKEQKDFIRIIEIKANQNFEAFHKILKKSIKLNGNELASFYICDKKWNKFKEITLIDMSDEKRPTDIMKESKIKDFIEYPHQRIIYEYDFLNIKTFHIELIKTETYKKEIRYPRCILSKGKIKNNLRKKTSIDPSDIDKDALLKDFEDILNGNYDNDYYNDDD